MRCPIALLLLIDHCDLVVDADVFFPGDAREKMTQVTSPW
jgi:hypothetical protein